MNRKGINAASRRAALLVSLACVAFQLHLVAQTIEVKLINGRNGRPMANKWVDLGIGDIVDMLRIPTDKNGAASFRLTNDEAEVNTFIVCISKAM